MKPFRILLSIALTGIALSSCSNNAWWEPLSITTYDEIDQPLSRFSFTYDERGNKFTEIGEVWDATTEQWNKDYRMSYAYDSFNIRSGAVMERRDSAAQRWIPIKRIHYNYTDNYQLDTETYQVWDESSEGWVDDYKDHYITNDKGDLLHVVREKWNDGKVGKDILLRGLFVVKATVQTDKVGWYNYVRDSFIYEEDQIVGGVVETWNTDSLRWESEYRYMYTKDTKGRILFESEETWDSTTMGWKKLGQYIYTYDRHGNAIDTRYQTLTGTPQPRNTFLIFYFNNTLSNAGYYIGDTGLYSGSHGTATYIRRKK